MKTKIFLNGLSLTFDVQSLYNIYISSSIYKGFAMNMTRFFSCSFDVQLMYSHVQSKF